MRADLLLDRADRRIIAVASQDVAPILERNAQLRSRPQRSDFARHIASIPNVVLVRWLNEEHARGNSELRMFTPAFYALVACKLQDPEWKYLRADK